MSSRGGEQYIPRPPTVRLGRPAPWLRLPSGARHLSLDEVRRRCALLPQPRRMLTSVPGMRAAAVLVPLFEEDDETRLILTKRPDTMPSHRGDIAFPGGKRHPDVDDSLLDAALREAEEEIGLPRRAVEVVAELDTLSTVTTRFLIAPFVGLLAGRPELVPDAREVVSVFDVALAELMADGVHREEHWGMGSLTREVHFFELEDETIWGATAKILACFLELLTAGG
jgi:8-oxo-dGTP pyrophosphatase MutT (NUDIX family)